VLNDHERETLREVERGLLNEDPEFARSFDARAQHLPRVSRMSGVTVFLIAGLLLSAFVMIIGSLAGAAAFAAATALIWLVWRFSDDVPPRSP
jgi:hypothetical protein